MSRQPGGTAIVTVLLASSLLSAQTVASKSQPSEDEGAATFGTTVVVPFGLVGELYYLHPNMDRLPDFDKLVPVGRIYTSRLNIPPRDFTGGFPGVSTRVEWFAIDYSGRFWVDKPGKFTFSLQSDDGSRLYIDDRLEIDNDGVHAPVTIAASVNLTRGIHKIRVPFFQGPRYSLALVLSVCPPGGKWKIFNTNDFKPPTDTTNWDASDLKALEELQKEPSRKPRKTSKELAAEDAAIEKIKGDSLPQDFRFRSEVLQFPGVGKDGKVDCTIAYEVPFASLKPQVDSYSETRTWRFVLLALIRDENDKVVDEMKLDVPFAVPEGQAKAVVGRYFTYARNFRVPPGKHRVTMGVMDRESGKITAAAATINSDGGAGIKLSSLVMVDHTQPGAATDQYDPLIYHGQRLVPLLSRNLDLNEQRTIFLVARADSAIPEKPRLEIAFLVDGKQVASQTASMPDPNDAGLIPMSFAAPAHAGKCELRLTAVQGSGRVTKTITYEMGAAR